MEFTVNSSCLNEELSLIAGAISPKTNIPILANVAIRASAGEIQVTGTDLEVTVRSSCEARVKVEGAVTLSAKRLRDIVAQLPDGELEFKVGKSNWVTVTAKESKYRFAGLPIEDFPVMPKAPKTAVHIAPGVLASLLKRCAIGLCGEGDSRYTLNAALLKIDEKQSLAVATDGHRMAHVTGPAGDEELTVMVPGRAVRIVAAIAAKSIVETVGIKKDSRNLFFEFGRSLIVARLQEGAFPNYEAVLPKDSDKRAVVEVADLSMALKRSAVMSELNSEAKYRTSKMAFSYGKIEIGTSDKDHGEALETLKTNYIQEDITAGFSIRYLAEFLSVVGTEQATVKFRDAEHAFEFQSPDGDFRYVVMPVRI